MYICNRYYKPSLHVSTDCLHANTQDDHANYDLFRANSFSSSSATRQLKLGGTKKQQRRTKKKNYSQEVAGALSPPTPPSYSLRRGTIFCQRATKGAKQSRPAAGCSSLKNSKGNGWISLRLFITSQPCRRNREFSLNSVLNRIHDGHQYKEVGKCLQQQVRSCNLLHNNKMTAMPCYFTS